MKKIFSACMFIFICTAIGETSVSAAETRPVKSMVLTQPEKTVLNKLQRDTSTISINGRKFKLLSEQSDHWLLYDQQMSQYCITLNMLVVVSEQLQELLETAGVKYQSEHWQKLADHTYQWTGSFPATQRLYQKLKRQPNIQLEWQLQYLPLSRHDES
ncbi:hypothetical protein EOE67_08240 [Rheinheimera riviphila]|uniref:Uncharacterized protein n=1 Tax=Rheinheimera riviphila TaxID=1834037 RepID=A0A437QZL4_9GAMM|nr:hypothetical protein [Rheinheimera riviphila]RVU39893.1 hypothetical protein EOE67_08240 [Rheinheimera riviphila]